MLRFPGQMRNHTSAKSTLELRVLTLMAVASLMAGAPVGQASAQGKAAPPPTPPPLGPSTTELPPSLRWRYYGNTVVDWGGWKRRPDGVRYTLVQPAANDVGEARAQATAIAVDCASLRHNWRVKDAWEAWTIPAPRSVGQQIVLDLCATADRQAP